MYVCIFFINFFFSMLNEITTSSASLVSRWIMYCFCPVFIVCIDFHRDCLVKKNFLMLMMMLQSLKCPKTKSMF